MTAAVPDPRFRDQLASAIRRAGLGPEDGLGWEQDAVENLLPLIAARMEARVQAAANQRAAEVVEPGLSVESNGRRLAWFTDDELAAELKRRHEPVSAPQSVVNVHPRQGHETAPVSSPTAATAPALPIPVEPTE